ncbi:MAG: universal stress protein [Ilumatobacter sp.]|nr:universal stress protein [Ilumatobacter sp.]
MENGSPAPGRLVTDILFNPLAARGNTAAVRRVLQLADSNGASTTMVGVVPEPTRLERLAHGTEHVEQVLSAAHDDMRRRLDRCQPDDRAIPATVEIGSSSLSLIMRAIAAGHDLVAVTDDDDDDHDATIRRLLRKCPCPVWVIRPTRASTIRVLAAVDPQPEEQELNEFVLDLAAHFAQAFDGELHVATAWQLYGESTLQSSAFAHAADPDFVPRARARTRQAHVDAVHALTGDRPEPWEIHVEEGEASSVIRQVIDRERINILVMGTVARAGLSGLVMGNTAERLVDTVGCSLVAVKPPGFVSPVLA